MEKLTLRMADSNDMRLVFEWANDMEIRKNSFCSEPISWETHERWYRNLMSDDDRYLFIFEKEEKPIGQIRMEKVNSLMCKKVYKISYSIGRQYRGRGYGSIMIDMAERRMLELCCESFELIAEVKFDNVASKSTFEKMGYCAIVDKDIIIYKKSSKEILP